MKNVLAIAVTLALASFSTFAAPTHPHGNPEHHGLLEEAVGLGVGLVPGGPVLKWGLKALTHSRGGGVLRREPGLVHDIDERNFHVDFD